MIYPCDGSQQRALAATVRANDAQPIARFQVQRNVVKGENIQAPGIPESFRVLAKEMQSLALNVEVLNAEGNVVALKEEDRDEGDRAAEERANLSRRGVACRQRPVHRIRPVRADLLAPADEGRRRGRAELDQQIPPALKISKAMVAPQEHQAGQGAACDLGFVQRIAPKHLILQFFTQDFIWKNKIHLVSVQNIKFDQMLHLMETLKDPHIA